MKDRRIKIEEAVKIIDGIVTRTEADFYKAHNRHINFLDENDYVLLADHIDLEGEEKKHWPKDSERPVIYGTSITYNLVKNFLKREGFFAGEHQDQFFDGIVGRLEYNPSWREYKFRKEKLEDLKNKGIEFPTDFKDFKKTARDVSKICFLKNLYEKDREAYEKGYKKIGYHVVNPSADIASIYREADNFEDFIKIWDAISKKNPLDLRDFYL